jgi:light-harvesting complex 1 beta chain
MQQASASLSRLRKEEATEFRLVFMASFVIFLLIGLVARILPWRWRPFPPGPEGYRSIVGEAKAAANMFVPLAFMG